MQSVRIYEILDCKMVTSGTGMFGEEKFDKFNEWFSALPISIFSKDYLFWDGVGFQWLYLYDETLNVPVEYEIIDFKGGLYAVGTDIDQQTDVDAMKIQVDEFLDANGFERDLDRKELGNIITPPSAYKIMGYNQMDYYSPIKAKG